MSMSTISFSDSITVFQQFTCIQFQIFSLHVFDYRILFQFYLSFPCTKRYLNGLRFLMRKLCQRHVKTAFDDFGYFDYTLIFLLPFANNEFINFSNEAPPLLKHNLINSFSECFADILLKYMRLLKAVLIFLCKRFDHIILILGIFGV